MTQPQDEGRVVPFDDNGRAMKSGNTVVALKEKKIPNDKRMTTPYMTKYERARVLGVRATQIR